MASNLNNCTITLSGDILSNSKKQRNLQSQFTGTPGKLFFLRLGLTLLSIIPFVGLPNAVCIYNRYMCKHTYIVGMPLQFEGKAGELLINMFKWGFFTVITLGIYGMVLLPVRVEQWKAANTVFGSVTA